MTGTRRALLIQRDPRTRAQLRDQLAHRGYVVEACATLSEGREAYQRQSLVVTTTERDISVPGGFIAWLREQPVEEADRPYILAVCEAAAVATTPSLNRQWDGLLSLPLEPGQLEERLSAVDRWMAHRNRSEAVPAAPGFTTTPVQLFGEAPLLKPPLAPVPAPLLSPSRVREVTAFPPPPPAVREHADVDRAVVSPPVPGEPWQVVADPGGVSLGRGIPGGEAEAAGAREKLRDRLGASLWEGDFAPVVHLDLRGHILEVNGAAAKLSGGGVAAPEPLCFWEVFVHESHREVFKIEFLAAAQESRERGRFAFPPSLAARMRIGTRLRKAVWAFLPSEDEAGRPDGVVCLGVVLPEAGGDPFRPDEEGNSLQVSPELLHHVPFGLILLDASRTTLFANREHRTLLGLDVADFTDIEHWVAAAAPRPDLEEETARNWRETVWRRQSNQTLTLRAVDRSLREIEFRPRPTVDGGMILTLFDVTDRRREEESRRASEAKFRALFQGSGVGIALEDASGLLFDVNPAFEAITGGTRGEARRTGLRDWIHPEDWPVVEALIRRDGGPARGGPGPVVEVRLRGRTGEERWGRLSASHIADPEDRLVFQAYFITDVSAEHSARDDLRTTREEHRAILRAVPDLILMVDGEGVVVDLIPAASGILIPAASPAVGVPLDDLVPAFQGLVRDLVSQTLASGDLSLHEFPVDLGEGFTRHFEARFVASGENRCVVVIQDVTPIHQARAVLQRHALIFEHSREAIVITDPNGRVTDWNAAAENMFGYPRDQATGEALATFFSPGDRSGFNRMVAEALQNNGAWSGTTVFHRGDGSQGMCAVHYVVVMDETGRSASIIGTNREIGLAKPL